MTRTIGKIITRLTNETGVPPTDEAVAKLLAISMARVAHHRRLLAGGPS